MVSCVYDAADFAFVFHVIHTSLGRMGVQIDNRSSVRQEIANLHGIVAVIKDEVHDPTGPVIRMEVSIVILGWEVRARIPEATRRGIPRKSWAREARAADVQYPAIDIYPRRASAPVHFRKDM